MSRNSYDYYPTPPEAALPLMDFIRAHKVEFKRALDPAAGSGALPRWLEPLGAKWEAQELCAEWYPMLADTPGVEFVTTGNSLEELWSGIPVVANPPFGKLLVRFMSRIHDHCRKHKVFGAVLVPSPWWGEPKRAERWNPDYLLWVTGRMRFKLTESTVPTTHVWSIFMPGPEEHTRIAWSEPGRPTPEQRRLHQKMMKFDPFQLELFA